VTGLRIRDRLRALSTTIHEDSAECNSSNSIVENGERVIARPKIRKAVSLDEEEDSFRGTEGEIECTEGAIPSRSRTDLCEAESLVGRDSQSESFMTGTVQRHGKNGEITVLFNDGIEVDVSITDCRNLSLVEGGGLDPEQRYFRNLVVVGDLQGVQGFLRGVSSKHRLHMNAPDPVGQTLLHLAASGGFLDICKELVKQCNADVQAASKLSVAYSKQTQALEREKTWPLTSAALNGHADIVRYLILECDSPVYESALYGALLKGHIDVCSILLNEGAPYEELGELDILSQYPKESVSELTRYVKSLEAPDETAVGKGEAHEYKDKDYEVMQVDWYTTPLKDLLVKKLGGVHSILVLTVLTSQTKKEIIIEKVLSSYENENDVSYQIERQTMRLTIPLPSPSRWFCRIFERRRQAVSLFTSRSPGKELQIK
jgi:hypothetical protein